MPSKSRHRFPPETLQMIDGVEHYVCKDGTLVDFVLGPGKYGWRKPNASKKKTYHELTPRVKKVHCEEYSRHLAEEEKERKRLAKNAKERERWRKGKAKKAEEERREAAASGRGGREEDLVERGGTLARPAPATSRTNGTAGGTTVAPSPNFRETTPDIGARTTDVRSGEEVGALKELAANAAKNAGKNTEEIGALVKVAADQSESIGALGNDLSELTKIAGGLAVATSKLTEEMGALTTVVSQNSKAMAKNNEAIAENSKAIAKNNEAIAENSKKITSLTANAQSDRERVEGLERNQDGTAKKVANLEKEVARLRSRGADLHDALPYQASNLSGPPATPTRICATAAVVETPPTASSTAAADASPEDMDTLTKYTLGGFGDMNNALRTVTGNASRGKCNLIVSPRTFEKVCSLKRALDSCPLFIGRCYRAVSLPDETIDVLKDNAGGLWSDSAFVSTSKVSFEEIETSSFDRSKGGSKLRARYRNSNTWFTVDATTGRDISHVSKYPGEKEVLFSPGTQFRIVSFEKDKETGKNLVHLKQHSQDRIG